MPVVAVINNEGCRSANRGTNRWHRGWGWTVALLLSTAACGDRAARAGATIDTLETGVIVVSNPSTGVWDEGSAWRLTDLVTIGTRHGEGPEVFGDVRSITLDDAGRVYVLDAHVQEVRVFDNEGAYLRTIGGHGGGPGEIGFASGIVVDPVDRLWVPDYGNQRYSVFDTTGALVKEMPFRGNVRWAEWTSGVFTPEGDLYDRIPVGIGQTAAGYGRYDTLRGEFVDTVRPASAFSDEAPGFPWRQTIATPRGWWHGMRLEYRLWERTWEGKTLRIVERAHTGNPLSAEQRDSARLAVREIRRLARGRDVDVEVPDAQPVFDRFIVDDRDHLWVQLTHEPDATTTTFDVFDPEGVHLGAVRTSDRVAPFHPTPVVRSGRIAFVTKDELDVPYVVVARIEGR